MLEIVLLIAAIQLSTLRLFSLISTASSSLGFVVCRLVLRHTAASALSGAYAVNARKKEH